MTAAGRLWGAPPSTAVLRDRLRLCTLQSDAIGWNLCQRAGAGDLDALVEIARAEAAECAGLRELAQRMDQPGLAGLIPARDQSDAGLVLLLTSAAPSAEQRCSAAAEWRRRFLAGPFGLPPGASERMRQAHKVAHAAWATA